jgi:hypothetical protein
MNAASTSRFIPRARSSRFKYRFLDKEKHATLCTYPHISFAQVRKKRDAFRQQIAQESGLDTANSAQKKTEHFLRTN